MIETASYIVSSPKRVMALLAVSMVAVLLTQLIPNMFDSGSTAPGVGAEQVIPDTIAQYANLFDSPRSVPADTVRDAAVQNPGTGFSQPSDEPRTDVEEVVSEIAVAVPAKASSPGEPAVQLVVRPTFSWVNVFGDSVTVNGEAVQVGDVITAFDPDGTLVGHFTVKTEGRFGLMPLYQDDPATRVDEGADPGDEITFEINGIPAVPLGPHEPVWTSNGAIMMSNLAAAE